MCGLRRLLRGRDDRGAAAVEFGLIVLPLLTLLIGIIQASVWLWAYQVGAHAAREGARQYAVDPCGNHTDLIRERIGGAAEGIPDGSAASVSLPTYADVNDAAVAEPKVGDQVTVTVTFDAPEIGGLLPSLPTISKSATSRIEYIPAGSCP